MSQNKYYKEYSSKEEYNEAFYQKMYDRESGGVGLHIDTKGIVTLPGGVATHCIDDTELDKFLGKMGCEKHLIPSYREKIREVNAKRFELEKIDVDLKKGNLSGEKEQAVRNRKDKISSESKEKLGIGNPFLPHGMKEDDSIKREFIEIKHKEAADAVDRFLKKNGIEIPENAISKIELESMAYNSPALLGDGLATALKHAQSTGDFSKVDHEIRNRSNKSGSTGGNNRRGKESNGFQSGLKNPSKVAPKTPYKNDVKHIANGAVVDAEHKAKFAKLNSDKCYNIYPTDNNCNSLDILSSDDSLDFKIPEFDENSIKVGYIWRADGDSKTRCDACAEHEDKSFDSLDSVPELPVHPNCKCEIEAVVDLNGVEDIDGLIQDIEQVKNDLFDKINQAETSQEKQRLNKKIEILHGKSDEAEELKKSYQDLIGSVSSFNGNKFRTVSDAESAEGEFLSSLN
ncbi:MAG: hypothetical protein GY793_02280 [Proteobacteria bacterium]|nr:hypothetical protein [Pseudomonadota bacterium]